MIYREIICARLNAATHMIARGLGMTAGKLVWRAVNFARWEFILLPCLSGVWVLVVFEHLWYDDLSEEMAKEDGCIVVYNTMR